VISEAKGRNYGKVGSHANNTAAAAGTRNLKRVPPVGRRKPQSISPFAMPCMPRRQGNQGTELPAAHQKAAEQELFELDAPELARIGAS